MSWKEAYLMNTRQQFAVAVDPGPVRDAALILATRSSLADHVAITDGGYVTEIRTSGDIPFDLWGSGAQALWKLLASIAHRRNEVSLYEVASCLDHGNRIAAAQALTALFGGPR